MLAQYRNYRKWTPEEDAAVMRLTKFDAEAIAIVARALGRGASGVRHRIRITHAEELRKKKMARRQRIIALCLRDERVSA